MRKRMASLVLGILLSATAAWAEGDTDDKEGNPPVDEDKVIAVLELLELMDLVQEMDMLKDMQYLTEGESNEDQD